MTKSADPNSKRSRKRTNRSFVMSRPNRRALRRLNWALGAHNPSDPGSNEPGALKKW